MAQQIKLVESSGGGARWAWLRCSRCRCIRPLRSHNHLTLLSTHTIAALKVAAPLSMSPSSSFVAHIPRYSSCDPASSKPYTKPLPHGLEHWESVVTVGFGVIGCECCSNGLALQPPARTPPWARTHENMAIQMKHVLRFSNEESINLL